MEESSTQLALLACATCRRQKRKCSRELPECQLCRKNRRRCEYSQHTPSTTADSETGLAAPSSHLFPPLFFLDSYEFTQRRSSILFPPTLLPQEFQITDSNADQYAHFLDLYFKTTHVFLPIVSKRRLSQQISAAGNNSPEIVLLLHCMCALASCRGKEDPSPEMAYDKAKRLFQFIEGRGIISVRVLQAGLLLSLYEAANAIYPAAFLTSGHCARIGHALGIHDRRNVSQMFSSPVSWTEMEEHRRIWWAVIVMDRFINLGLGDRPFACDNARPEDLLPMSEELWDLGEQTVIPSLAVTGDTKIPAPAFARTCQAVHLLSRVLSNISSSDVSRPPVDRYNEAQQLLQVLTSFCVGLQQELTPSKFMAYSSAMGICCSALITLCDNYSCADMDDPSGVGLQEQLMVQESALRGLHETGNFICTFASGLIDYLDTGEHNQIASPFVAQCLYSAAKQYKWYIQETGKMELLQTVEILKSALKAIGKQWIVAVEYLALLERDESLLGA